MAEKICRQMLGATKNFFKKCTCVCLCEQVFISNECELIDVAKNCLHIKCLGEAVGCVM